MAIRLAPLSWSVLPSATLSTGASLFEKGAPGANITNVDVRKQAWGRGSFVVTAGVNDKSDYNDGTARVATVAAATYNNPQAYAIAVAAAHNVASTNWQAYWAQDSTNRNRFIIGRTSGTASLQIQSGANTATNTLKLLMGYGDYDRASGASHTGDMPIIHGTLGDTWLWDLGSVKTSQLAVLANPRSSSGLQPVVRFGTTSSVTNASEVFGDHDTELMAAWFAAPLNYQHVRLDLVDRNNDQMSQIGMGLNYLGNYFEPSHNWEWSTFGHTPEVHSVSVRGITGLPFIAEVQPGDSFGISWSSSPGIGPDEIGAFEAMLTGLGLHDEVIIGFDSADDPTGLTKLCRVASMPQPVRAMTSGPMGRYQLSLQLEAVAIL